MMRPTRRGLLGGLAGSAGITMTVMPLRGAIAATPDADLIRLAAEHVVNMDAYNRDGGTMPLDDDPLWLAYEHTRNAISEAKPHTLEGMLAKARAAKAEARGLDGVENPEGTPASRWAWDLVNDLLTGRMVA